MPDPEQYKKRIAHALKQYELVSRHYGNPGWTVFMTNVSDEGADYILLNASKKKPAKATPQMRLFK